MHAYLQAAHDAIAHETDGLSPDAIVRPIEGRWCIAEILEHLTLGFARNADAVRKALASGELRARTPRLTEQLIRILVVDIGYFPRAEAPQTSKPTGSIPPERSVAASLDALRSLDTALAEAAQRFGEDRRIANHPYFSGLTVPQWRKFHWRHTLHHMRQVRERRERQP